MCTDLMVILMHLKSFKIHVKETVIQALSGQQPFDLGAIS